jgi:ABC-type transport system involved in cytochrome bd biosynthesis fused ATPase/permease subunit
LDYPVVKSSGWQLPEPCSSNRKYWCSNEATSSLDLATAEHFAGTINQLKGKVTMLFITHALPKNLQVDEVVRIGSAMLASVAVPHGAHLPAESLETQAELSA